MDCVKVAHSHVFPEIQVDKIVGTSDMKKVTDLKGNPLLLFINAWSVGMTEDRNPDLILTEFSK